MNCAGRVPHRPQRRGDANGDAAMVRRCDGGALIAVIDALGHGAHAAEAAGGGLRYLAEAPSAGLRASSRGCTIACAAPAGPRRCCSC